MMEQRCIGISISKFYLVSKFRTSISGQKERCFGVTSSIVPNIVIFHIDIEEETLILNMMSEETSYMILDTVSCAILFAIDFPTQVPLFSALQAVTMTTNSKTSVISMIPSWSKQTTTFHLQF
jgi:hypothetical protein